MLRQGFAGPGVEIRAFLTQVHDIAVPDGAAASTVASATGLMALTRTFERASSTAMARVAAIIQTLVALYQARFGRGLTPPVEAITQPER